MSNWFRIWNASRTASSPVLGLNTDRRNVGHRKIHIVAQIGHVPIERRRVGNDAEWVVIDVEFAADILDHDAPSGGVVHDIMRLRSEAPSAEHDGGDDD